MPARSGQQKLVLTRKPVSGSCIRGTGALGRTNPVRATFRLRPPLRSFVRHVILPTELRAAGDEEMIDKGSEQLGDQLQRVVATGLTKAEAKRAICVGIRGGQIQVWPQIEKIYPEKENFVYRRRFRSGDLKYLFPHEIDWEKSLFIGQLQKITDSSPLFRLKWIELCNEGVRRLCNEISWRQAGIVKGTVADLYNLADLTT